MRKFTAILLSATASLLLAASNPAPVPRGKAFPTADAAAKAFIAASKSGNKQAIIEILGPSSKDLIATSDPANDRRIRSDFNRRANQKMRLVAIKGQPAAKVLVIGNDDWPLPIPIIQVRGQWYFDMAKGRQEILNRRIGGNELDAIEVCRGYVEAQNMYADMNHTDNGRSYYAQKIISTPGEKDGLYWPGEPGVSESPIGNMIAKALAEGYTSGQPFHGYYFRVLKNQGPHAPGGEMSYIEDGKMTRGFALVAWPATYGLTGVMTFLVDKTGIVYQKDLGPNTSQIASQYTSYDVDESWKPVSNRMTTP